MYDYSNTKSWCQYIEEKNITLLLDNTANQQYSDSILVE